MYRLEVDDKTEGAALRRESIDESLDEDEPSKTPTGRANAGPFQLSDSVARQINNKKPVLMPTSAVMTGDKSVSSKGQQQMGYTAEQVEDNFFDRKTGKNRSLTDEHVKKKEMIGYPSKIMIPSSSSNTSTKNTKISQDDDFDEKPQHIKISEIGQNQHLPSIKETSPLQKRPHFL